MNILHGTGSASSKIDSYNFPVTIATSSVHSSHNLFCWDRTRGIAPRSAEYSVTGEQTDVSNNKLAYILSETENRSSLANGEVQKSIWWYLKTDLGQNQGTGLEVTDLYQAATKFDEYRKNYVEPSLDSSRASQSTTNDGKYEIGPFKLTYKTTYYKNQDTGFERSFGEITGFDLVSGSNTVSKDNWYLENSSKQKMDSYPASGENFYIVVLPDSVTSSTKVKIQFNDLQATGHYYMLTGKYTSPAWGGGLWFCEDCKNDNAYTTTTETRWVPCGGQISVAEQNPDNIEGLSLSTIYAGGCGKIMEVDKAEYHTYNSVTGTSSTSYTTGTAYCGTGFDYFVYANGILVTKARSIKYCRRYKTGNIYTIS